MAFEQRLDVVEHVKALTGDLIYRDPHAFTNAVAYELWKEDQNWGHNIKRGNQGLSEDAIFYKNPSLSTGGHIVDIIGSAGSPDASPAWIDQTQATAAKGEIGAWSKPYPWQRSEEPKPVPTPTPTPTPVPAVKCEFKPCDCTCGFNEDRLNQLAQRVEELAAHFDTVLNDVLARLDRNFNKPSGGSRWPF